MAVKITYNCKRKFWVRLNFNLITNLYAQLQVLTILHFKCNHVQNELCCVSSDYTMCLFKMCSVYKTFENKYLHVELSVLKLCNISNRNTVSAIRKRHMYLSMYIVHTCQECPTLMITLFIKKWLKTLDAHCHIHGDFFFEALQSFNI